MKKSAISAFLFPVFLIGAMLVISCNSKPKQAHDAMKKDSAEVVVYACSMHPEVTGKEGDKCSKCGMKLEAMQSSDSTKNHADHSK